MTLCRGSCVLACSLLATGCAFAQAQLPTDRTENQFAQPNEYRRIAVEVTSISGDSIYLNQGRASGLRPRDKIVLSPTDGSEQVLFVDAISRSSSRCVSAGPMPQVAVGTLGIGFASGPKAASAPELPSVPVNPPVENDLAPFDAHPQWAQSVEPWPSDQPLLAQSRMLEPHERETQIQGQLFSQYLHSWNWKFGDNQYSFGRTGLDLKIENPFGDGGRIRFRGDLDLRGTDLFDGGPAVDFLGRVSLLSYAWGGLEQQPTRFEIGRFLPSEFPEFGFLDGMEWIYQASARQRFGFSVGALPEPFPSFQSGEDLQAAVFYRFTADETDSFSIGAGYQKTWNNGDPDRDLFVLQADYHPNAKFHAHGTIWTDYYGSHDTLKPNSWEITEAIFNQSLQFSPIAGIGTYYSQLRWPQLLRREIDPIFALQILRNRRSSYGAYLWRDLSPQLRLNGRLDRWQNQDALGGTTWETELYFRQLGGGPIDAAVAFLMTDGLYVSGPGARVALMRYFSRGLASVAYTVGDYRLTDDAQRLMNQAITTSLDLYSPTGHSFSLFGDYRFGEAQGAASIGLIWRKRF